MKRRDFLKLAGGVPLTPALASSTAPITCEPMWPLLAKSILAKDELLGGVCLLDFGDTKTQISAYQNEICLLSEHLKFGSEAVSAVIQKATGENADVVHKILQTSAHAFSLSVEGDQKIEILGADGQSLLIKKLTQRVLSRQIEDLFATIFEQVRDILAQRNLDLACGVVAHGTCARLPGIVDLGEAVFLAPVRVVPAIHAPFSGVIN